MTDATAAAGREALEAAETNYEFVTHETATTDEVVDRLTTANATAETVSADGAVDATDD